MKGCDDTFVYFLLGIHDTCSRLIRCRYNSYLIYTYKVSILYLLFKIDQILKDFTIYENSTLMYDKY